MKLVKDISLFMIVILMLNCSTKKTTHVEPYYVIKQLKSNTAFFGAILLPPLPPSIFYGNYNIILLGKDKIFYHKNNRFYTCATGLDLTKPPRLFLEPASLREIKINDLSAFLNNIFPADSSEAIAFSVVISSQNDTIKNDAFRLIFKQIKEKKIKRYSIRNWTEEEKFVLQAKMENRKYNADTEKWLVGFDFNTTLLKSK